MEKGTVHQYYIHACAYLTIYSSKKNLILSRSSRIYWDLAGTMQWSMCFQLYGMSTSRYAWPIYMQAWLVLLTLPPPLPLSESQQGETLSQEGIPSVQQDWQPHWQHLCYWWVHVLGWPKLRPFKYLAFFPCHSLWRQHWISDQSYSLGYIQGYHSHP